MAEVPEKREGFVPRPPPVRTTTDFIVLVFVIMVASIFVILTLTAVCLALFTDKSVSPFIAIITDTMTTIVAALVGYVAGRAERSKE